MVIYLLDDLGNFLTDTVSNRLIAEDPILAVVPLRLRLHG